MIAEGLRTLLLAQSAVTDIVGQKIFVTAARQGTAPPYIVIDRIEDEKQQALDGFINARICEVDIECWASTAKSASALAKVLSDFLDDYTGAAGDETILASIHLDEFDGSDPPDSGSEITEFSTTLNMEFQYRE